MLQPFDFSLDRDAVGALLRCSEREGQFLVDACETLARHPMSGGDYSVVDSAGRENQVIDLGAFVTTYWTDHGRAS